MYVEKMKAVPRLLNLVIPTSKPLLRGLVGGAPSVGVPPLNVWPTPPVVTGYPPPKTIPPAYRFPSGSGAAVNPQLSESEPVNEEKVIDGSITTVSESV
ncbi:hypothetical protein D3C86_1589050 [compost metagenome]